ncbi:hypothetical protein M419DRAFT_117714 [Trichoderma reesei RUT C-30]|uniref:Uncharacterized protein n=1 Tax=Hypocrea jecorina (strain ATCC 56765 / BCRC 32924 / NRRL 11460 / Rut C-30) TaxID=1344414 RepID=A0A024SLS9_HYPJR|nr:hypothetical protein M419DRAFT_117714 [Trichoderma reesei RUT C-30]
MKGDQDQEASINNPFLSNIPAPFAGTSRHQQHNAFRLDMQVKGSPPSSEISVFPSHPHTLPENMRKTKDPVGKLVDLTPACMQASKQQNTQNFPIHHAACR